MKILTFDVEDWFHILEHPDTASPTSWRHFPTRLREGVDTILQCLDDTNQQATFFCLGWVTQNYPDVIRKIDASGHHIGSHSYAHQLAYEQDPKEYFDDLKLSKEIIENTIGKRIDTYRAPGFSITKSNFWAFEILIELGFAVDSSIFPANRAHGGLPDLSVSGPSIGVVGADRIKLFPINCRRFFGHSFIYSGGGYFRLFPKSLINKWVRDDTYVMTYFHPRDFDPNQPVIPGLSWSRQFKSYIGIKGALGKLYEILEANTFLDIRSADAQVDWDTAPLIDLNFSESNRDGAGVRSHQT